MMIVSKCANRFQWRGVMGALAAMAVVTALSVPAGPASADTAATHTVAKNKQTLAGKYMTPNEAYEAVTSNRGKTLFLDIRTVPELMFVGMTNEVDGVIPFVTIADPPQWDNRSGSFRLQPNRDFVRQVEAALAAKGLSKNDTVILMCRSGSRTVPAVNTLVAAGFKNAYSLYDGFEGDSAKDGSRSVNGWKNAGLPWTTKLDKAKAVPPGGP